MFGKVSPGKVNKGAEEDYSLEKMDLDRKDDDNGDYYNTMVNRNVKETINSIESGHPTERK